MNVTFDELSIMAFKQCSSKPELQGRIDGHLSLGLDLTYAPSTDQQVVSKPSSETLIKKILTRRTLYSLKEMDLESAQNNAVAKLPLLKQGDYEMWKLRIEQYFQLQDYAEWNVIENGNSFKLVPQTIENADGTSTSTIPGPVTTEEKAQKKNDVKARSMLLMALPNKHLLTFSQYKDDKTLFEAIQARFSNNDATKKTQSTLLKQITPVSTVSTHYNTTNLSDATVYAFLANQPNRSQLIHEDQEQIHEDDLEEMDLKWQLALPSMRARRELEINALNLQIEKLKKEKESNQIKIDNFKNASKSLDKLRESQISDNSRTGLGFASYSVVSPPPTGLFAPLFIDLSNSGLEEFQHPEFKGYGHKDSKSVYVDTSNEIKKAPDALIIKDWVSNSDEDESEVMMAQKHVLKNMEKGTSQREVRPLCNNSMRINHQKFSNSKRNLDLIVVLTKFRIVSISTARQSSSRAASPVSAARPINTVALKPLVNVAKPRHKALQKSHSLSRRPFYQQTAFKNRNLNYKVNTAKVNSINTAKGNRVTSAIRKQGINAVKSLACWVWRPKIKVQDHVSKNSGSYIYALKDQESFNSGCFKHMTGNISYPTDFKEHDGGYVAFGGGVKGDKITGKGTIRTGKLDFEDVNFHKQAEKNKS
nr:hypothetical protein [Tanacetum cinerariifolium]